jgi:hypothetical protein
VVGCANCRSLRSMRSGQQRENMRAISPGHVVTVSAHDACGAMICDAVYSYWVERATNTGEGMLGSSRWQS